GMSTNRVPILLWGTVTVSVSILFALPALTVSCLFLYLDRHFGMHFFDPDHGGQPLLWQHLFWMFGHPWVYIVVLPAMSMASDMLPTMCRRPLIGYTYVAVATVGVGILGFGVWEHHMFAVGLSPISLSFFSGASMVIAIPSAVSVFAWIATMWYGRPVRNTVLLFLVGFIVLFVIGGVDGVVTASAPFDWQVTDSYYIVAHLHYVLIGINVFPVIAGVHYWFPKATGRMMSERLGRWSFWLMFVGFNVAFFPMHFLGLLGMPRRIYTYAPWQGWAMWNLVATIGSFLFATGFLVVLINVWRSYRNGARASANPWGAGTLEWSMSSPPPPYNFAQIPYVASRHPLWEGEIGERRSVLDQGPPLDDGHQAVSTSALDANPTAILPMPGDSLWPFYLSVATLFLFYGLVYDSFVVAGVSAFAVAACMVGWLWPGASIAQFDEPEESRTADEMLASALPVAMSDLSSVPVGAAVEPHPPGQWAMALLIVTEASLFAYLLFSYFYLGVRSPSHWPPFGAPALRIAIPNTAILLSSSGALYWAERRLAANDVARAKWGLMLTMLLGALFLCFQGAEYARTPFTPQSNAYGSAFFTITGLHGSHVFVGLLLLGVVLTMLWRGKLSSERRHFLSNAALYWHFVDAVWIAVFASLYLVPRFLV
ncbi:MAG: cbb3-type cytochrome c oxidase subunit I, partial [Gemmatimonadaceae bacterium]